jgi:hypothetical protein
MKSVPEFNRSMHPNYGIDAPNLVKAFMAVGIAGCVLAPAGFFYSLVSIAGPRLADSSG